MANIHDYTEEKICEFKGEKYAVRDNGAVFRYPRSVRVRKCDNTWVWGDKKPSGYLEIAGERVHRIVATAFHGEAPSPQHVVDHIDTNRQNNRPENLRWVTKEENILKNPNTVRKIEYITGYSIEEIKENWELLHQHNSQQDFSWMRTVSKEEAENLHQRQAKWLKNSPKYHENNKMGEWVFHEKSDKAEKVVRSLTPGAVQRNWKVPVEFPCCPDYTAGTSLHEYLNNLQTGKVFCKNKYYQAVVEKCQMARDIDAIVVKCMNIENEVKPWHICVIVFENGQFVHTSMCSCFTNEGAEKRYVIALGEEWTGEDSIDDYC